MFWTIFLAVFLAISFWNLLDVKIGKYDTPIACWIAVIFMLPFAWLWRLRLPKHQRAPLL